MPDRTCRHCDGTGNVSFGVDCEHCAGTGTAPPDAVPRPFGIDERRRQAPTDRQVRRLADLVAQGDRHDPAVHLASEALGRSDSDRDTVQCHIDVLTSHRLVVPVLRACRTPVRQRPLPVPAWAWWLTALLVLAVVAVMVTLALVVWWLPLLAAIIGPVLRAGVARSNRT